MNKRDFLKGGATAIAASAGSAAAWAAGRPGVTELSGMASWQAHVGEQFRVDGHAVALEAVVRVPGQQPGEQFSLSFVGQLPDEFGNQVHLLAGDRGEPVVLYLARTSGGLRADFCRLQG